MLYSNDRSPYSYSESPVLPGNVMMYMNFPSSSDSYSDALAMNSQRLSNSTDIHLPESKSQNEVLLNFGTSQSLQQDFNSWKDDRNEMVMMQSLEGGSGVHQGLSLSLSTHVPSALQLLNMQHADLSPVLGSGPLTSGEDRGGINMSMENEDSFQRNMILDGTKADISSYGVARAIHNSRYLKVAQQLLDEVVNVKKGMKERNAEKNLKEVDGKLGDEGNSDPSAGSAGDSAVPHGSGKNSTSELSANEKQELQNKMAKLLSMLDEVDRRYRQYYHQMQIVVSSFDMIAGSGAAKPYTALALQTISRHFRCLRDAISGQIQVARKNLGEEDASLNDKGIGISRLRYVDQQLRQQRTLQQLGMMQQHAWRPQRGLPETSVSILRAWLFEHFLHPYPKDSDKIMLARQTGLTRSQVSNWFINVRVRLWKPMVEEMYKEEAGDADIDSNSSSEATPRPLPTTDTKTSKDKGEDLRQTASSSGQVFKSKSEQLPDVQMIGPDSNSTFQNLLSGVPERNGPHIFPGSVPESSFGSQRFMYHMPELERYGNGSGVSLTLGLQQGEVNNMAIRESGFVPMRGNEVCNGGDSDMGSGNVEFDRMDSENQSHRFVSSLLPSFT